MAALLPSSFSSASVAACLACVALVVIHHMRHRQKAIRSASDDQHRPIYRAAAGDAAALSLDDDGSAGIEGVTPPPQRKGTEGSGESHRTTRDGELSSASGKSSRQTRFTFLRRRATKPRKVVAIAEEPAEEVPGRSETPGQVRSGRVRSAWPLRVGREGRQGQQWYKPHDFDRAEASVRKGEMTAAKRKRFVNRAQRGRGKPAGANANADTYLYPFDWEAYDAGEAGSAVQAEEDAPDSPEAASPDAGTAASSGEDVQVEGSRGQGPPVRRRWCLCFS